MAKKIGIISCGSIGQRYINILQKKKFEIIAWNRNSPRKLLVEKKYKIKIFTNLDDFLKNKFFAIFICSPNSMHLDHALKSVNSSKKIFIEKPFSHSKKNVSKLISICKNKKINSHICCNLRFHTAYKLIKKLLKNNKYGKIVWVSIWGSSYLPDWHPYENYLNMYSAKKKMGGGAVFDYYHEIDIAYWFFGKPKNIISSISKSKILKLQTEECFDAILQYSDFQVNLHCDYFHKPLDRGIKIVFKNGWLEWNFKNHKILYYDYKTNSLKTIKTINKNEKDKMYIKQIDYFIKSSKSFSNVKEASIVQDMCFDIKKIS